MAGFTAPEKDLEQAAPPVAGAAAPAPAAGAPAGGFTAPESDAPGELDYSGAPYKVRALVGLAKTPEDQLATLKRVYPDARVIEIGPKLPSRRQAAGLPPAEAPPAQQLMVFTNPETKRLTVFNPPGLDFGDVMGFARPVARGAAFAGGYAAGAGLLPGGQVSGVLTGVAASQGTDELIDRLLNPALGVVDTRTGAEKMLERGSDVLTELPAAVALTAGDAAVRGVAGAVRPGTGGLGPRGARLRIPSAAGSGRREVYDALKQMGVEKPPAAAVSSSREVQGLVEAGLTHPHTADILQPAYDKALTQIRAAMEKETAVPGQAAGQVRKDIAGKALTGGRGGLTAWRESAKAGVDRAEATMDHLMAQRPVAPDATAQYIASAREELGSLEATAKAILPREYWALKADLDKGGAVPWQALRKVRTMIGRNLEDASAADREAYAPLYKALSTDLERSAAEAKGQMPGLWRDTMALEKANAEAWSEVADLARQKNVETAFNMAAQGAAQGPSLLEAIKGKVSRDTWDKLVNTIARDKFITATDQGVEAGGLQTEAVASPTAFAKWWRQMKRSGSADVLAPAGSAKRTAFDRWETVGAAWEQSRVMRNYSRTASGMRYTEALEGGAPGAAQEAAAAGQAAGKEGLTAMADKAAGKLIHVGMDAWRRVSARSRAELVADPDFAKWTVDSRAIKLGDPHGRAAHLERLTGIAVHKPQVRGAIEEMIQNMKDGAGGGGDAPSGNGSGNKR